MLFTAQGHKFYDAYEIKRALKECYQASTVVSNSCSCLPNNVLFKLIYHNSDNIPTLLINVTWSISGNKKTNS
jgi:hypothetical protein